MYFETQLLIIWCTYLYTRVATCVSYLSIFVCPMICPIHHKYVYIVEMQACRTRLLVSNACPCMLRFVFFVILFNECNFSDPTRNGTRKCQPEIRLLLDY